MSDLTDQQRIARGHNAKRAIEEFLDPAFEVVMEEYHRRMVVICSTTPWADKKISALANATRIVNEVRNQVVSLVAEGEKALSDKKRAERVEALSPARRRLFNIGQN